MKTTVLVLGQGLSGTWLSYWLYRAGIDFLVVDEERPNTSTRVASGVINPVTGRRMSKTWLAETIIPFAADAYGQLQDLLNCQLITQIQILDFFNSPDRRIDFSRKASAFEDFLHWPADEHSWNQTLDYGLGFGIIAPAYQVNLQSMLEGWRQWLRTNNRLVTQRLDMATLEVSGDGVIAGDLSAEYLVCANGIEAAATGHFQLLPFALNKGEVLILDVPDLDPGYIYKKGNTITPWREGLFWAGSTYDNHFTDILPSASFREKMESWLKGFLKVPFIITDHLAAIRPATVERRPFVGFHPQLPRLGIMNGMGTKGVTLAPYFAQQLVSQLQTGHSIMPEADIARFSRILAR